MTKALYFDLQHGLSGDMILATLTGCCDDPDTAIKDLEALDLEEGFQIKLSHVKRSSIDTMHIDVLNDHGHVADQESDHDHGHHHGDHHGHGGHRHLSSIIKIIQKTSMTDQAKALACDVFQKLGEAEAAAHDIDIEKVHFHEVGALDSMVDIIGSCFLFDHLQLDTLLFNRFHFGSGTVKASHGTLPLPVPAVARLTAGYQFVNTSIQGELITPTAAAILTVLGKQVDHVYGTSLKSLFVSGSKHYEGTPGFVRANLLEQKAHKHMHKHFVIEVNLDDISGERMAYALERALQAGARDAWAEQILMKKGRPAVKLCLLCDEKHREQLEEQLLSDTHAWGLRTTFVHKRELPREEKTTQTPYGTIRYKIGTLPNESTHLKWEWDDVVALAKEKNIPLNTLLKRLAQELSQD